MKINPINSDSQNFQARIRIKKPDLGKIAEYSAVGTTAVGSLALQTDFDLGAVQASIAKGINDEQTYKGITLPLSVEAFHSAEENNKNSFGDITIAGISVLTIPSVFQLYGSYGSSLLDCLSNNKKEKTSDKKLPS